LTHTLYNDMMCLLVEDVDEILLLTLLLGVLYYG
jgi:hypothetical protein